MELHWPVDIFQRSLAQVIERKAGLASDLFEGAAGQADAARRALVFHARRDVDAVTKNVVTVDDDVPDINADTEDDLRSALGIARGHLRLNGHGAGYRVHCAREFDEHPVAGGLDDTTFMAGDCRIDYFSSDRLQGHQGADLVPAHKAAITRDVGCQYSGKPSFHPLRRQGMALPVQSQGIKAYRAATRLGAASASGHKQKISQSNREVCLAPNTGHRRARSSRRIWRIVWFLIFRNNS